MIRIIFYKNKAERLVGFEAMNHGKDLVCAAVSVLSQNTVNSIEAYTDADFHVDVDTEGGYMGFMLDFGQGVDKDAELLLKSLMLGIQQIKNEYEDELDIIVEEV